MNGLCDLSNIHDLRLLCSTDDAVKCQLDVKLARYLGVCVTIFFFFRSSPTPAYRQYLLFP